MTPIAILVAGTHGHKNPWWHPGSPFMQALIAAGIRPADISDPYVWCTNLDGLFGSNKVWEAAGSALRWYAQAKIRHYPVSIVAHSHGGQVAAYAAAHGLYVDKLITVATPVRKDMEDVYRAASMNIGSWYHLHSDSDFWQVLGALRDGAWGIHREMPYADMNLMVRNVNHSEFLNPEMWEKNNWWDWLK